MTNIQVTPNPFSVRSWVLAARPKTLTVAIIPILVGTFLAKASAVSIDWSLMWFGMASAIFITIGTNLNNDALDFKKGTDTADRLGPKRATQSGLLSADQVLAGGWICYALAFAAAIPLIVKGGIILLLLMVVSITCGYLYTGGPMPLSYCGIADLFVLIFYGFVSICSMYYLQTGFVNLSSILAGLQIGLLAMLLLSLNNLRDYEGDAKANKKTLAVRFGVEFGKWQITALILTTFFLNPLWVAHKYWLAAILPFFFSTDWHFNY